MFRPLIVVEGVLPTELDDTNLREDGVSLALDQRAFGPRRLLVAFADRDGRFRGLAHVERTDPPEKALAPCIQHIGLGSAAAVGGMFPRSSSARTRRPRRGPASCEGRSAGVALGDE